MRAGARRAGTLRAAALTVALLAAAAGGAAGRAAAQGRLAVRVETEVRPDSVGLGQLVHLRWRMWLPDGSSASFPGRPADDSLFRWTEWRAETVRAGRDQREHRLVAAFQSFALGTVALPGPRVRFEVPGEGVREGRFPTASLTVVSSLPAGGPDPPPHDLKPPVAPPWWALVPWPWVAAAVIALALAVWAIARWRARRRAGAGPAEVAVPEEAPEIEARRRLAALVARGLPEAGRTYEHGSELADLLRRFVERRFGRLVPGDTTRELALRLGAGGEVAAGDVAALRDILEACDLTKFARRPYDAPRAHAAEAEAARLIATWATPATPAAAPAGDGAGPGAARGAGGGR